jgi:uncharacterized membrane-anchored protein
MFFDIDLLLPLGILALCVFIFWRQVKFVRLIKGLAFVQFDSVKCGYVSMENWGDTQVKILWKEIGDEIEGMNAGRKKLGLKDIELLEWTQEPIYDKNKNSLYYAIKLKQGSRTYTNTVALLLTRDGFERITLISDKRNHAWVSAGFNPFIGAYTFEPGSRYEDFVEGDKVSVFGVDALESLKDCTQMYVFDYWDNFLKSYTPQKNIL